MALYLAIVGRVEMAQILDSENEEQIYVAEEQQRTYECAWRLFYRISEYGDRDGIINDIRMGYKLSRNPQIVWKSPPVTTFYDLLAIKYDNQIK